MPDAPTPVRAAATTATPPPGAVELKGRLAAAERAIRDAEAAIPDLRGLIDRGTPSLARAWMAHFVRGEAPSGFAVAPPEKQAWIDSITADLHRALGLDLPPVGVTMRDDFSVAQEARCSRVIREGGEALYVLGFGQHDYAFMRERVAHELGHADLDASVRRSGSAYAQHLDLAARLKDLYRAHDADHGIRPVLQALDARLGEAGYPAHRFQQTLVYDAHHELYADFIAALEANDPEAIVRCEAISQGGTITDAPEQWRARSFSVESEPPSGAISPHIALAAVRARLWTATQAAMPPLMRADVARIVRDTISQNLDQTLVSGASDLEFRGALGERGDALVARLEQALAMATAKPRSPWQMRL